MKYIKEHKKSRLEWELLRHVISWLGVFILFFHDGNVERKLPLVIYQRLIVSLDFCSSTRIISRETHL